MSCSTFPTVVRGIKAAGPPAPTAINRIGTPVASVTGTSTLQDVWRLTFKAGQYSSIVCDAFGFHNTFKTSRIVVSAGVYVDLIPGLTITLGTIAVNDMADVIYTALFIVNTT